LREIRSNSLEQIEHEGRRLNLSATIVETYRKLRVQIYTTKTRSPQRTY
jgi:hypothetical protein